MLLLSLLILLIFPLSLLLTAPLPTRHLCCRVVRHFPSPSRAAAVGMCRKRWIFLILWSAFSGRSWDLEDVVW